MIPLKKALFVMSTTVIIVLGLMIVGCADDGTLNETASESITNSSDAAESAPADPDINADNAQAWRETMQQYRADESTDQLLLVRYTGGCSAKACYYIKNEESNDAWELIFEEQDAYVGKHGIGKTVEGDAATPTGDFKATGAFGILPDPGTSLEWTDITPSTFSCDEDCQYYNQIVDTELTEHDCTGEEMYAYSPEYNYGIVLDYNPDNVYPLGSAVYLHCKGPKYFTGGCIAISQEHMETILKTATPGFTVCIGND